MKKTIEKDILEALKPFIRKNRIQERIQMEGYVFFVKPSSFKDENQATVPV